LLRVLLDSHSHILALPETPWLLGSYGSDASLRGLLTGLSEGSYGLVRNVAGIGREDVRLAGNDFLERLFQPVLEARGKSVVAFKTPADIRNLDFVTEFLPGARYIHITRDGRDVAMSQLAKKGSFFHDLKEYRRLSYTNVFRRWVEWEQKVRSTLYRGGLNVVHVRYEDLVADPEGQLKRIMDFLGLPFERGMLDYASQDHDYPAWEAGSTDVAGHGAIQGASIGKWRGRKMSRDGARVPRSPSIPWSGLSWMPAPIFTGCGCARCFAILAASWPVWHCCCWRCSFFCHPRFWVRSAWPPTIINRCSASRRACISC
jgi:hypothetical protein